MNREQRRAAKRAKPLRPTNQRRISTDGNIAFWLPIQTAIERQAMHPSVAAVSTEPLSDNLKSALTDPLRNGIANMLAGRAQFIDFWSALQTMYWLTHAVGYVLEEEKFSADPSTEQLMRVRYSILKDNLTSSWCRVIENIGERYKRTGKYGLAGNERDILNQVLGEVEELISWGTVRMAYRVLKRCKANLIDVEHTIRKGKAAWKDDAQTAV